MPWLWSVEGHHGERGGEEEMKEDSGDLSDRYYGCGPWRATTRDRGGGGRTERG